MMIKVIGLAGIFFSCTCMGLFMSQAFVQRQNQIREFKVFLNLLETEINYLATPLPLIFEKFKNSLDGNIRTFLTQFLKIFHEEPSKTASEIWVESIKALEQTSKLKGDDYQILLNFGLGLGSSSKEEQIKNIKFTQELLHKQYCQAEIERNKNEKLYKTMGLLLGLGLALIFI
jgi:stage III sporulation protein AB